MYEAQIDSIQEWADEAISAYEDYISVVKESLDAERDLYDFKKNIEKQTSDIAKTERKIASLSGADDAASVAERRKLEATLYDQKRDLEDSYREHSLSSQQQALDDEAAAYEEAMNKFVEGLRTSLNTALEDMGTFMSGVYNAVITNAPAIKKEYKKLGISLDDAIVKPWDAAAAAMKKFGGVDGLEVMNSWINEGGIFPTFKSNATDALESPWTAGQTALGKFKTSVKTEMGNVYKSVQTNVSNSLTELNKLKSETGKVTNTTTRAPSESGNTGGGKTTGGITYNADVAKLQNVLNTVFNAGLQVDGKYGPATTKAVKDAQKKMGIAVNGKYDQKTATSMAKYMVDQQEAWKKLPTGSSAIGQGVAALTYALTTLPLPMYAKGTLGTKRDEWAITDESWIGEEITLAAGKNGQLQYLKKGSAVMPADISANLVEWGKLNPNMMTMGGVGTNLNMISNAVVQPSYEFNFDSLVHVDHCDEGTLKNLEKMVDNKINDFSKSLNYSMKRFAR